MTVAVTLIAAMADNRVIGRDNQLPWHLPEDLKYFKKVTLGKPIVMGRKTYQSIGRPLPGRANIVLTRDTSFSAEGVSVYNTIDKALEAATAIATADGVDEVMVIGGAELYQSLLSRADRLYLTRVHASVEGDAYFPELDWSEWQQTFNEQHTSTSEHILAYSFSRYQRK